MELNEAISKIVHATLPDIPLKVRVVTRDSRGNAMLAYREVDVNYVGDTDPLPGRKAAAYVSIDEADIAAAPALDSYNKELALPRMPKFMELSTAHMMRRDAELLEAGTAVVRLDREEGCFVHVSDTAHGHLDRDLAAMTEAGYSNEIRRLFGLARKYGCDWILFDRDVESTPGLPTFEW